MNSVLATDHTVRHRFCANKAVMVKISAGRTIRTVNSCLLERFAGRSDPALVVCTSGAAANVATTMLRIPVSVHTRTETEKEAQAWEGEGQTNSCLEGRRTHTEEDTDGQADMICGGLGVRGREGKEGERLVCARTRGKE